MRLYILKMKRAEDVAYDDTDKVVVRAETAREARKIAATGPGFNKKHFLDVTKTTCRALRYEGESGIICADTRWG